MASSFKVVFSFFSNGCYQCCAHCLWGLGSFVVQYHGLWRSPSDITLCQELGQQRSQRPITSVNCECQCTLSLQVSSCRKLAKCSVFTSVLTCWSQLPCNKIAKAVADRELPWEWQLPGGAAANAGLNNIWRQWSCSGTLATSGKGQNIEFSSSLAPPPGYSCCVPFYEHSNLQEICLDARSPLCVIVSTRSALNLAFASFFAGL